MFGWKRKSEAADAAAGETERLLDHCFFALTESATLTVRPTDAVLTPEGLERLVIALRRGQLAGRISKIIFDLAEVRAFGPRWTVVLAMLIAFARSVGVPCHVQVAGGQPASVLDLYRRSTEVRALVG
jgi:hypothetical protein